MCGNGQAMRSLLLHPGVLQPLERHLDFTTRAQTASTNNHAYTKLTSACSDAQKGNALRGPRFRLLRWQANNERDCSPEDVLAVAEALPDCFKEVRHLFERVMHVNGARHHPKDADAVVTFSAIRAAANWVGLHRDALNTMDQAPSLDALHMVHLAEPRCLRQLRLEAVQGGDPQSPHGERPVLSLGDLARQLSNGAAPSGACGCGRSPSTRCRRSSSC